MPNFFSHIPTTAYPLGAGLFVTSSLFFGNLGLALAGPLPIIKEELGTSGLDPRSKLRIWKLFFDAATPYVVGGTGATVLLHAAVAFLTESLVVRNLAIGSAVTSAAAIGYTVLTIAPTNATLSKLDSQATTSEADDKNAMQLIAKWNTLHKFRVMIYGSAWALGLAALLSV